MMIVEDVKNGVNFEVELYIDADTFKDGVSTFLAPSRRRSVLITSVEGYQRLFELDDGYMRREDSVIDGVMFSFS